MTVAPAEVKPLTTVSETEEPQTEEPSAPLMQLPLFEGHRTVETRLNFGGNILITDQELGDALKLGNEVEIVIKGRVVSRGFKSKDDGQAVSSAAVVVDSVSPLN